jgi:hypothetical protein
MAIRSLRVPGAVVLMLAMIASCGGAATSTSSPISTAASSAVSTPAPATTPAGGGALEDLVPDEVGGVRLVKKTVHGPDIGELDPEEAANFAKVLENVEGPLEGFSEVSATGTGLAISAWRMEGTDGGQLGDAFISFVLGLGQAEVEDVTIGAKEVKRVTPANTTPLHVYVTGEVMFVVQAEDQALVEEAFAALP